MNDGTILATYMREYSQKFKNLGWKVVFVLIGTIWTLSYKDGAFAPSIYSLCSLVLGIIYVFLELLYLIFLTLYYKKLLNKYFDKIKDGDFIYKNKNDALIIEKKTKKCQNIGEVWLLIDASILLLSFVLLIISLLNL